MFFFFLCETTSYLTCGDLKFRLCGGRKLGFGRGKIYLWVTVSCQITVIKTKSN